MNRSRVMRAPCFHSYPVDIEQHASPRLPLFGHPFFDCFWLSAAFYVVDDLRECMSLSYSCCF